MSESNPMGNNQIKKRAAELHNKKRSEQLALELDKKNNPEKYKRKRPIRQSTSATAFIATAMVISPNGFNERLLK